MKSSFNNLQANAMGPYRANKLVSGKEEVSEKTVEAPTQQMEAE